MKIKSTILKTLALFGLTASSLQAQNATYNYSNVGANTKLYDMAIVNNQAWVVGTRISGTVRTPLLYKFSSVNSTYSESVLLSQVSDRGSLAESISPDGKVIGGAFVNSIGNSPNAIGAYWRNTGTGSFGGQTVLPDLDLPNSRIDILDSLSNVNPDGSFQSGVTAISRPYLYNSIQGYVPLPVISGTGDIFSSSEDGKILIGVADDSSSPLGREAIWRKDASQNFTLSVSGANSSALTDLSPDGSIIGGQTDTLDSNFNLTSRFASLLIGSNRYPVVNQTGQPYPFASIDGITNFFTYQNASTFLVVGDTNGYESFSPRNTEAFIGVYSAGAVVAKPFSQWFSEVTGGATLPKVFKYISDIRVTFDATATYLHFAGYSLDDNGLYLRVKLTSVPVNTPSISIALATPNTTTYKVRSNIRFSGTVRPVGDRTISVRWNFSSTSSYNPPTGVASMTFRPTRTGTYSVIAKTYEGRQIIATSNPIIITVTR